jgi:hypothetical protein
MATFIHGLHGIPRKSFLGLFNYAKCPLISHSVGWLPHLVATLLIGHSIKQPPHSAASPLIDYSINKSPN